MTPGSNKIVVVLRKELRDALRDRRAIGTLLLFVALYPFILWMALHKIIDVSRAAEQESIKLSVIGGTQVPTLLDLLKQKNITVETRDDMNDAQITALLHQREQVAVLKINDKFSADYRAMRPARVELWYDSATEGQSKLRRVENVLHNYNNAIAGARVLAHGVSPATLMPVEIQTYDTATNASRSARILGALLGMFFAATFFFCMNTAMDSTAGERERRSLEILMVQPVRPFQIVAGKWLAAGIISLAGLALEMLFAHLILKWMPLEEIGMSWRVSWPMLCAMIVCTAPLCLFAAAFEIALAMNAKTFKEAQTMMSFALLLPMLPAIIVPMLDVNTQWWMYAVPVLANQTLLLELAKNQAVGAIPVLLTIAGSLTAAAIAIGFASWRLRSEQYVLGV